MAGRDGLARRLAVFMVKQDIFIDAVRAKMKLNFPTRKKETCSDHVERTLYERTAVMIMNTIKRFFF